MFSFHLFDNIKPKSRFFLFNSNYNVNSFIDNFIIFSLHRYLLGGIYELKLFVFAICFLSSTANTHEGSPLFCMMMVKFKV